MTNKKCSWYVRWNVYGKNCWFSRRKKKIDRGISLFTGSRAKKLAKNIRDIEDEKNNLKLYQKLLGKKATLNKAQRDLYKQFDAEARNVDLARKGAIGVGAVAIGAKKAIDNNEKKSQTTSTAPIDYNVVY